MESHTQLRVVIVDDHDSLRAALRLLIDLQPSMVAVGEADNGLEAIRLAEQLQPDIILMDVRMPGMDGINATRQIKLAHPTIRVLILTNEIDPEQQCAPSRGRRIPAQNRLD